LAVVVALLATGATGCGGPNELRSAKQARTFIDDVIEGNASKWKVADDADQAAIGLWIDRVMIESLGTRLKQVGSEWGCYDAGGTTQARESLDECLL